MLRFLSVMALLFAAHVAHAGGVAVCSDPSKEGQYLYACLPQLSYQSAPTQSVLILTCQASSVKVGHQDMTKCPVTVWKKPSAIVPSELVGYCDQSQISPPSACDAPNGAEGWALAQNVLGAGVSQPSPPATQTGPLTLNWRAVSLNVDGQSATVTGYRIEYGQSNFAQSVTTTGTSYNFVLAVGTWKFRVIALSSYGESVPTNPLFASVAAGSAPPPAPTVALSANPTSITAGNSTTLSWSSVNATSCTGVGTGTSGSVGVSPTSTRSYTQTCSGAGGTTSASVAVTVTAAQPANWVVASNAGSSTRSVYEAVLPVSGTALVRGNADGQIAVGKPCGAAVFVEGSTNYRSIANSDAQLNSPTYANRSHVAVCVQQ